MPDTLKITNKGDILSTIGGDTRKEGMKKGGGKREPYNIKEVEGRIA